MVDKGFRKIALTLIGISVITAITAGVYLYFNFNAKSRLPLVVPDSATWFLQLRTNNIKEDVRSSIPDSYVAVVDSIRSAPAFQHLKDPGQTGLSLLSDVVLFQTPRATFFALSMSNENRFSTFLDTLKLKGFMHGKVVKPNYTYAQVVGKSWYVIYKLKAMVVMQPVNTGASPTEIESMIEEVFNGKPTHFLENKLIQNLYDNDCQVIIWSKNNGNQAACGYKLSDQTTQKFTQGAFSEKESFGKWLFPDYLKMGQHSLNSLNILSQNDVENQLYGKTPREDVQSAKFILDYLFSSVIVWRDGDIHSNQQAGECLSH